MSVRTLAITCLVLGSCVAADAAAKVEPTPPEGAPDYQAPPRPTDGANLALTVPHQQVWPDPEAVNSHQEPQALRAVCQKHGVEFVENRRELTEYMLAHKLPIESLLGDSVHQTQYAARMTNRNIARHVHRPAAFAYDPRSRERRVEAEAADAPPASPPCPLPTSGEGERGWGAPRRLHGESD